MTPEQNLVRLQAAFRKQGRVIVAFSGGVDSALLAKVGADTLGTDCLAVIVDSESYAREEREAAEGFARALDIPHEVIFHSEMADARYAANPINRCYFCREGLSSALGAMASERSYHAIAAGTNMDDLDVPRPGTQALTEAQVWQPYLDLGMTKADIRALAHHLALPVWNKPSMACLSSRIPYGEPVTFEKLTRIGRAESILRARGFTQVRVRTLDDGARARIEVPAEEIAALRAGLHEVEPAFRLLGYTAVVVDPRGYRTGAMNEGLNLA